MYNEGYVPFSEEYDLRIFTKNYEKNEIYFKRLMNEVSEMNQNISTELYVPCNEVRYELYDGEWKVIIFNESYDRIYEENKPVENIESVVEIEKTFDETLFGITYNIDNGEYVFNIGEYYRIYINGDNVDVK